VETCGAASSALVALRAALIAASARRFSCPGRIIAFVSSAFPVGDMVIRRRGLYRV